MKVNLTLKLQYISRTRGFFNVGAFSDLLYVERTHSPEYGNIATDLGEVLNRCHCSVTCLCSKVSDVAGCSSRYEIILSQNNIDLATSALHKNKSQSAHSE